MNKLYIFGIYLVILIYCCNLTYGLDVEGWNYLNLHCRDNDNIPIDWWFIYKPPTEIIPYTRLGRNFTFITSDEPGRWRASFPHTNINSNSLLQHTLSPIFRPTYSDHIAIAIYDRKKDSKNLGSAAHGVLMADEVGGVWIGHTVPDLINFKRERPLFPEEETANGHLLMCLSVDLETINLIARYLSHTSPHFTHIQIPETLIKYLPEWSFQQPPLTVSRLKPLTFTTKGKSLQSELHVRRPGDQQCLYRSFARAKHIILDVYGQSESDYLTTVCAQSFGVRNIENISLKQHDPDRVFYFHNMTDRMRFAVSTAAHWQKRGSGPIQYWTCISDLDKEDTRGVGGHLLFPIRLAITVGAQIKLFHSLALVL
ncbi:unnamed protein product [Colias eurytheme]|nr:unnamed protein product [Colias eurytheme]